MTSLRHEMDRLFDRFFEPRGEDFELVGEWAPKVDVKENKDSVVVKAEIPGVDQKDLSVALQDQVLTISGSKNQEKEEKDERYHRVERSYGSFSRSFRLPAGVETEKVTAGFKDGVLTITLPKSERAKSTSIPIKA
jgi:HSP20 family protein